MAKEMRAHNLLNFPQLKELPNLVWQTAKASQKDKDGNVREWEYQHPVFDGSQVPEIVRILGNDNLAAILTDEAKLIYRSAPTEEKLMSDAVAALVRTGKFTREEAEAMFA